MTAKSGSGQSRTGNLARGAQIAELRVKLGSIKAAAEFLGVNPNTARGDLYVYNQAVKRGKTIACAVPGVTETDTDDFKIITSDGEAIQSLDDLLRVCKVDRKLWKVQRCEKKAYQGFRRDEKKHLEFIDGRMTGHVIDNGLPTVVTMYSIKAWLVRREERPFEEVIEGLIADLEKLTKRRKFVTPKRSKGDYLLVPSLFEIHVGRLTANGGYPPAQARADMIMACKAMIERTLCLDMAIDRIMLPVGNDFLNADNMRGTTTKGTWQEMAAGQYESVDAACRGYIDMIDMLSEVAPVDVVVVPSNHDRYSTYWLGLFLSAWYRNAKHISIDAGKASRKYYRYGNTLIGLEHGDKVKAANLALIMAEESSDWGEVKYKQWLRGHFHKEYGMLTPIATHGGVLVETVPAFCPPNEWELLMGYIPAHRAAEARYYHHRYGPAGKFSIFMENGK